MMIYTEAEHFTIDTFDDEDMGKSDISRTDTSILRFCEFVDYYTRHSTNPLCTALACEKQAETVQITSQDVTPENMQMLIDTMLVVIDHLEKKWLDEHIQQEDVKRAYHRYLHELHAKVAKKQHNKGRLKNHLLGQQLYQKSTGWLRKWFGRIKPTPHKQGSRKLLSQKEVTAWQ